MNKRYILVGIFILCMIGGVSAFVHFEDMHRPLEIEKKISDVDANDIVEPEEIIKSVEKMQEEAARLQGQSEALDDATKEIKRDSQVVANIFQEIDISDVTSVQKSDIQPVGALSVEQGSISQIKVGDKIELPLLGNSNYEAKITKKIKNPTGSVTVSGNLVEDDKYSVVITESKKGVYGSITTPDGDYEIEVQNGKGYIYSVSDIENKRVDYKKSDEMTLPNE